MSKPVSIYISSSRDRESGNVFAACILEYGEYEKKITGCLVQREDCYVNTVDGNAFILRRALGLIENKSEVEVYITSSTKQFIENLDIASGFKRAPKGFTKGQGFTEFERLVEAINIRVDNGRIKINYEPESEKGRIVDEAAMGFRDTWTYNLSVHMDEEKSLKEKGISLDFSR